MDDLLDLNWSSSGSSSAQQKAASSGSAFDSLARAGSPGVNYYGSSSSSSNAIQPTRAVSPSVKPSSPSSAKDAFSSLFDSTPNGTRGASQNTSSMTMQQRMDMQRSGSGASASSSLNVPKAAQKGPADPWDFDMLTSTSPAPLAAPTSARSARPSSPFDDLADFGIAKNGSAASSSTKGKVASTPPDDSDDVLGLLGQPVPSKPRTASPPQLARRPASPPLHAPQPRRPSSNIASTSAASSRPPSRAVAARTPSPPPHILGQVVMMGFSVQQARLALGATLGGKQAGQWDIDGALEILASDGAASAERARESKPSKSSRATASYADERDSDDGRSTGRNVGALTEYRGAQRERRDAAEQPLPTRRQQAKSPANEKSDSPQADLLAQASVFGSSMLKSANAYWKTSRAQITKAVEENKFIQTHIQQAGLTPGSSAGNSRSATPNSGRPKWMTEDMSDVQDQSMNGRSKAASGGFRDEDEVLPPHPAERARPSAGEKAEINLFGDQNDTALPPHPFDRATASSSFQPVRITGLKAPEAEPRAYVSPNRRKAAAPPPPAGPASKPALSESRPVRPTRTPVPASASQLASSGQLRTIGNEHFKLGRYGEAVEAYGKALLQLPERHLARIAVLNNRANARLKNGEERKAGEDATAALSIILGGVITPDMAKQEDYQAAVAGLENAIAEDKLDGADALGKALSRRARAHEGCEKWRLAMLDWQMLVEMGDPRISKSAGGTSVISSGLARCRKVVEGGSSASSAPAKPVASAPKPRPSRPTAAPASTKPSAAVQALRQGSKKQEAEEKERQDLKDTVDAKIDGWKGGKETNLRALIASLDTVLWEGTGWNKVGMHELITDNQLKIRYMKAIAKVHPDKISKDATVEHRMIADSVFSALNDAWNAKSS